MTTSNKTAQLLEALADIVEVGEAILTYDNNSFALTPFEVKKLKDTAQKVVDPGNNDLVLDGLLQLKLLTIWKKRLPEKLVAFVEHKALHFKQIIQDTGGSIQ